MIHTADASIRIQASLSIDVRDDTQSLTGTPSENFADYAER
jgi:hypothetical protein